MADHDEQGCGWEWDHTPDIVYEDDEMIQWVCRECGAEVIEDKIAAGGGETTPTGDDDG